MPNDQRPEQIYRETTDKATRRRLQAAVVAEYRAKVSAFAARYVSADHRAEAEQVGLIGLLIALERYEPSLLVDDRVAVFFWSFASRFVRDEIRAWLDTGVYWRKSANRGPSPGGVAARAVAEIQRRAVSLDTPSGQDDDALVDRLCDDSPSPEDVAAAAEVSASLDVFAASLTPAERRNLLSENSQCVRSRHHLTLIERASAFVKGSDGDGSRNAVRCDTDTLRP